MKKRIVRKKIPYPKLPEGTDGRYKVAPEHTEEMKQMHRDGISLRKIAKAFGLKNKESVRQRILEPWERKALREKYKRRRAIIMADTELHKKQLEHYVKHRKKKKKIQGKEMRDYDFARGH